MSPGAPVNPVIGFKRHLRAEIQEGVGAFLFSERGVTALRGARVESVAALLDGTTELATVLDARPAGLEREEVVRLIEQLVEAGLVDVREPAELQADERALAFWDACGVGSTADRSGSGALGLYSVGATGPASVQAALEAAGFAVTVTGTPAPAPGADLSVVLCHDYLDPELAAVDAEHSAAGVPWLLAKPSGAQVWVGPVFGSPDTGCWHCLAHRLWGHRQAEACVQRLLGRSGPARRVTTTIPALAALAANAVSLEATKWLAGHRYSGQRSVWTLDGVDLVGQRHELRVRPQCPACGDRGLLARQANRPVRLAPTPMAGGGTGGQRARPAEQVLEDFRHLVSPVTGIVKEITRDRRGPAFCNAFVSGPNPGVRASGLRSLGRLVRNHSGGKGVTALDAEVGALCEAIERFSGTYQGDEERMRDSLRALGDRAVDPRESMLFDPRQYAGRDRWNATHASFQEVPEPFDENAQIDWTPVYSLTEQRHRLLPTAMLYYGFHGPGSTMVCADSNGNAAGSSMADAVLQGLLELVERDAVALWWYNRLTLPAVDLDAFDEPWLRDIRRNYADLGRELWVLDLTLDLGVPVMAAASRRVDGARENITFGFGAHLDPHIALRRAITEQNQLMPVMVGDEDGRFDDPDADRWFREATVAGQPYLLPDPALAARGPEHYGYREIGDISVSVRQLTTTLAEHGMETLVLDQTRPDIGLPVVKIVVPGLRHFWARYAPGRLFDVPVATGKLTEPTRFDELNPIPMFM